MDYLSPHVAYLPYSIWGHSVCVDKGGIICPYTSLGREAVLSGSYSHLLDNSYHDNPVVSKELRIEGN